MISSCPLNKLHHHSTSRHLIASALAASSGRTMRSFWSTTVFAFALVSPVLAAPSPEQPVAKPVEETLSIQTANPVNPLNSADGSAISSADDGVQPTTFNGVTVPVMRELKGHLFDQEIKDGYWFVEHYSPDCGHCQAIAPTWQTLYEFYYTSTPVPSATQAADGQSTLNSFHRFYNFNFARLNCIAYGTACKNNDVSSWPTFLLFKDGKFVKKFAGPRDLKGLSDFVEETLESIRPGSRPKDGVKLPEVGAKSVDAGVKPEVPAGKDKDTAAGAAAGSEHNLHATETRTTPESTKISLEGTKANGISNIASKSKPTANALGTSVPLSAESFQKLVTTTQDPWFIKFYAPWCHHCQALAPSWQQMAKELQGKLNVGEVNCEVESRLCKDVRIAGYPTIHFFRGGERVEYDGLRGLGDLVSYAKKALDVGMGVQYVDAAAFKQMEETEEVIFVYFYDHATTSEDFAALERLCLSLVGRAKIVKTDSAVLADRFKISTWPRLLVSRDGRPSYYNALAPKDMRDFRRVLNWMQTVWLPIVPELTASNSHEVMDGKYVVLGILSRERAEEFELDRREIKNAALEWMEKQTHAFQLERQEMRDAKQLRIEEAEDRNDQRALRAAKSIRIQIGEDDKKQVGFAWVDGVFWERWIRTTYGIEVRNGERVIINDEEVSFRI